MWEPALTTAKPQAAEITIGLRKLSRAARSQFRSGIDAHGKIRTKTFSQMALSERRKQTYEHDAENMLTILRSMLDAEVPVITIHSKMPFKAASVVQALLHRAVELGSDAKFLYENKRMMSSFILSRAIFETAAVMLWAVMSMQRYLVTGKIETLDDSLMIALGGSRLEGAKLSAKNINTILQQLDRRHPSSSGQTYQRIYSWFSEYAHPNSSSTLNQYATVDRKHVRMVFDGGFGKLPDQLPIHSLHMTLGHILGAFHEYMGTLGTFVLTFDTMQDIMTVIAKFHDSYQKKPQDPKAKFEYELVKEAPSMMARAMERFGERDHRYHVNDIIFEYHPENQNGGITVVDPIDPFGRIIYLGNNYINTVHPYGNMGEGKQRLAHELIHCLAPSGHNRAFEEGCCCIHGEEFSGIRLSLAWEKAHRLTEWVLKCCPNIIRNLRPSAEIGLSSLDVDNFLNYEPGLPKDIIEDICVHFIPQRDHNGTLFPNGTPDKPLPDPKTLKIKC